jgi:hypothetical protein
MSVMIPVLLGGMYNSLHVWTEKIKKGDDIAQIMNLSHISYVPIHIHCFTVQCDCAVSQYISLHNPIPRDNARTGRAISSSRISNNTSFCAHSHPHSIESPYTQILTRCATSKTTNRYFRMEATPRPCDRTFKKAKVRWAAGRFSSAS